MPSARLPLSPRCWLACLPVAIFHQAPGSLYKKQRQSGCLSDSGCGLRTSFVGFLFIADVISYVSMTALQNLPDQKLHCICTVCVIVGGFQVGAGVIISE